MKRTVRDVLAAERQRARWEERARIKARLEAFVCPVEMRDVLRAMIREIIT